MLKTAPAVFMVGRDYRITVEVKGKSLFRVKDNDYNATGGVMNSLPHFHCVTIPMGVLDAAAAIPIGKGGADDV